MQISLYNISYCAAVPKGREISAPHAAKRNVGLKEQLPISSERTTGYYSLPFVSPFQYFPDSVIRNPTFRCATCGAEISCPFGTTALCVLRVSVVRKEY
ncbi:hypothetical protein Barb4_04335 [Bacteroidales bacterium Barb4]|nr:hypothetical protein Barb4_04335 [Bacteroidales bacterium Barb4]